MLVMPAERALLTAQRKSSFVWMRPIFFKSAALAVCRPKLMRLMPALLNSRAFSMLKEFGFASLVNSRSLLIWKISARPSESFLMRPLLIQEGVPPPMKILSTLRVSSLYFAELPELYDEINLARFFKVGIRNGITNTV